VTVFVWREY